jgi:DNA-binding NarL/FixJ family response regulator
VIELIREGEAAGERFVLTGGGMVRVALFTDVPNLAAGVACTLAPAAGVELVFVCDRAANLVEQIKAHSPDVLLLDRTPDVTLGMLAKLQREVPSSSVVLWVRVIAPEAAYLAMELGVRAILRKTLPSEKLLECLRRVAEGEVWFEPNLTARFLTAKSVTLTRRESELVTLLAQGLKNKEIATALNISEPSVKAYLTKLFQKVGAKDRFELALYGMKNLTQMKSWQEEPGDSTAPSDRQSGKQDLSDIQGLRFLIVEKSSDGGMARWPIWEF